MRIQYVHCNAGEHFLRGLIAKYGLSKFKKIDEPCMWFGCYGEAQIETLLNHQSTAVMVWSGTDATVAVNNPKIVEKLKNAPHIQFIAISKFIADDMEKAGLPYKRIPILPYSNDDISPAPLGDSIYIYKAQHNTYGKPLNDKVKALMPDINFIECDFNTHKRSELIKIYRKCFLGLRFIRHDGLSNTVCELGLIGRKVIWNGDTPNAIPYDIDDIEDIVNKIRVEYENRKSTDYNSVSLQMKKFLDIGDSFLNI
ncbi:MAG: hypothetical protein IMZ64_07410 [Bacteroidetes bacterium]|nr:hypothetical protein [Bacteroidota bacterium]